MLPQNRSGVENIADHWSQKIFYAGKKKKGKDEKWGKKKKNERKERKRIERKRE